MARTHLIQTNWTAGEITPRLKSRDDLTKFGNAASTIQNFIVTPYGDLEKRGGTIHVKTSRSNAIIRLYAFEFSTEQAYIIEFGDQYLRFYRDGGLITESDVIISGATQANPVEITATAHGYSTGDEVFISSVVGMTELNGKYYTITSTGANTFTLDGIDGTSYTAYTSGGVSNRVYEVVSPYATADLFEIQFTQSADILYAAHPLYAPREISRTGDTSWTITEHEFIDGPYLDENTTTTTLAASATTGTGITITASATTGINNDVGFLDSDVGRLVRIDHSSNSGYAKVTSRNSSLQVVADVIEDFNATSAQTTWRLGYYYTDNYPAAVTFYEQRLTWGGSSDFPQLMAFSKTADFKTHSPGTEDDDAMVYIISADQVNAIEWLNSGDVLAVGTTGAEFIVSASDLDAAITPTNIRVVRHTTYGSYSTRSIRVSSIVLFVQRAQRKIREFVYQFESDNFVAPDLTLLAENITLSGITDIAYQQELYSILWTTMADGRCTSMTYHRQQEVVAWARQKFGGVSDTAGNPAIIESVAVIPGDADDGAGRDEVWISVKRYINGQTVRQIEYISEGLNDGKDQPFSIFLDASLQLNTPFTITAATQANPVVVTTSAAHGFTAGDEVDVREVAGMTELNGIRFTVANPTSTTFELSDIDGTAYTAYISGGEVRKAIDTISGLDYLEGEEVGVLSDGAVHPNRTVSNGSITLDTKGSIVCVGKKYTARLITLPGSEGQDSGTAQGRRKRTHKAYVRTYRSGPFKAGPVGGTLDTPPYRDFSDDMDTAPALVSDLVEILPDMGYSLEDEMEIVSDDPLPCNLLALIRETKVND